MGLGNARGTRAAAKKAPISDAASGTAASRPGRARRTAASEDETTPAASGANNKRSRSLKRSPDEVDDRASKRRKDDGDGKGEGAQTEGVDGTDSNGMNTTKDDPSDDSQTQVRRRWRCARGGGLGFRVPLRLLGFVLCVGHNSKLCRTWS